MHSLEESTAAPGRHKSVGPFLSSGLSYKARRMNQRKRQRKISYML
jgi:hypothetical protein